MGKSFENLMLNDYNTIYEKNILESNLMIVLGHLWWILYLVFVSKNTTFFFKFFCFLFFKASSICAGKKKFDEDLFLYMAMTDIISSEYRTRYIDQKTQDKTYICCNNEIAKSKVSALSHLNEIKPHDWITSNLWIIVPIMEKW